MDDFKPSSQIMKCILGKRGRVNVKLRTSKEEGSGNLKPSGFLINVVQILTWLIQL